MRANGSCSATERRAEVVVVGGGPAGSAAAVWCALLGLDVTLLESQSFPRHRPGESLHPGVTALLRQLGVEREVEEAGFLRYAGQTVAWGGAPHFQVFGRDRRGEWLGFQARREVFDAILLNRARAVGVRVFQPCRAGEPVRDGDRIVGTESSLGRFRSRIVIDATGPRQWLGRTLGGVSQATRRLIAYYGYARAVPPTDGPFPVLRADPGGWTWAAQLGPDSYTWVRLPFADRSGRGAPPPPLGGVSTTPTRGADVTWRVARAPAGPGYFVAGDAAAVLDPVSSHGILRALMSGVLAAHCAALVLRPGVAESQVIRAYHNECHGSFDREAAVMRELYARLPSSWQVSFDPTPLAPFRSPQTGGMPWERPSSPTFGTTSSPL